MPEMASLSVWDPQSKGPTGDPVPLQFNPAAMTVTYQTSSTDSPSDRPGGAGKQEQTYQPTGYSSQLRLDQLVFDTTDSGDDVRQTTLRIAAMMAPPDRSKAPMVQFQWGTFLFIGKISSMNETLDLFSAQGKPLRATVTLNLDGVETQKALPGPSGSGAGAAAGVGAGFSASAGFSAGASAGFSAGASASFSAGAGFSASASLGAGIGVGTTPLTLSQAGDSLQSLAGRAGVDWKVVADANNIDNPRMLGAGTVVDLNASATASASLGGR